MEKQRSIILSIFTVSPVFADRDAFQVQIMCWLWLAGIPQHPKTIRAGMIESGMDISELNLKKALSSLSEEGLIGNRTKMYKLNARGIELMNGWLKFSENA